MFEKKHFSYLDWIRTANRFKNLGSGPDLDRVNFGKSYGIFVVKNLYSVEFLDLDFTFKNFLDYCLSWTVSKILNWIVKSDSLLISGLCAYLF